MLAVATIKNRFGCHRSEIHMQKREMLSLVNESGFFRSKNAFLPLALSSFCRICRRKLVLAGYRSVRWDADKNII